MEQVDAPLTRLGTDYIDLYQIHRFDPDTPVEETMEALHDVVNAGKARYLGASSMAALAVRQAAARRHVERLDHVHLHAGPVQPHQPRGGAGDVRPARRPGGRRHPVEPAGPGRRHPPMAQDRTTNRGATGTDRFGRPLWLDTDQAMIDAVQRIAETRGVPMAQVALAWVLKNPVVDAPIVGVTKHHHLADAVAALDLNLTDDEISALEEPYVLRQPTWF
jgi:aryl-alcohol dehydrogenase-like predicted oxidoreductase